MPGRLIGHLGFILDFESGELDETEIVEGFQHLIDSGIVWQLQGSYGRMAARLIDSGHCSPALPTAGESRAILNHMKGSQNAD